MNRLDALAHTLTYSPETDRICNLLLDVGTRLLSSGAHCGRITRNLERIANAWGYELELFSSFTGLIITLQERNNSSNFITRFKRAPIHHVNFNLLSQVSILSWKVPEERLPIEKFEVEWVAIKSTLPFKRWQVLLGVGCACASLCMVAGGDWRNGATAFVAAIIGLFVRQETAKRRFNIMISCVAAAFITSLIAGMDGLFNIGASPEKTLATSVLYLVPGVPLINSVIDLIEGHIPTSLARGMFSGFVLLSIAVGMTLSILLIGIQN